MSEPSYCSGGGGVFRQSRPVNDIARRLSWFGGATVAGGGWRGWGVRACANSTARHTGGHARARRGRAGLATMGGWAGVASGARADKYYKIFKEGVHTTR